MIEAAAGFAMLYPELYPIAEYYLKALALGIGRLIVRWISTRS